MGAVDPWLVQIAGLAALDTPAKAAEIKPPRTNGAGTRERILALLPGTVAEIATAMQMDRRAVRSHLNFLVEAKVVAASKGRPAKFRRRTGATHDARTLAERQRAQQEARLLAALPGTVCEIADRAAVNRNTARSALVRLEQAGKIAATCHRPLTYGRRG